MPKLDPKVAAVGVGALGLAGYFLFRRGRAASFTPETREEAVFVTREGRQAAPGVQRRGGTAVAPTSSIGFDPNRDNIEANLPPMFAARTVKNCWAVADAAFPWKGPNNREMTTFGVDRLGPGRARAQTVTKGGGSGAKTIECHPAYAARIGTECGRWPPASDETNHFKADGRRAGQRAVIRDAHEHDWHWTRGNPDYPIIAPNWSCGTGWDAGFEYNFGRNNVNCQRRMQRRMLGDLANQIGLWPCDPGLWEAYGSRMLDIPDTEYAAPTRGSGGLPGERIYSKLGNVERIKQDNITGWQDTDGTVWVLSTESRNWRHISDADSNIGYFVSVRGKTAVNLRTMKGITNARDLNPRWKHYDVGDIPVGRNPWEFGPYQALNQGRRWTGRAPFSGYVVDYRPGALMTQCAPRSNITNTRFCLDYNNGVLRTDTGGIVPYANFGDVRITRAISLGVRQSYSILGGSPQVGYNNEPRTSRDREYRWPLISYGCRVPFRAPKSVQNAMPYAFAAPVFLHRWVNKTFIPRKFSGDR